MKIQFWNVGHHLSEWGLDFSAVADGMEAVAILEGSEPPDMALMDWMLPGLDGIDICRRIRKGTTRSYIYTVMLTARNRKQDLLLAMEAGADDYLSKPVDPSELRARILAGKRILELQQSLRRAANYDFLTNLLNRSQILAALEREISRSERERKATTVIMIDIDHFKHINDSLGHAVGDEVLKEVARRLTSDLRPYDFVGRYGGEEFLMVLPGCNLHTGVRRADEIRNLVSKDPISTPAGESSVTVSLGVTVTCASRQKSISDVLHEADMSMYSAKKSGRNRVEQFSPITSMASIG